MPPEFSMVIAGFGVNAGLAPELGPLSAAYVLFLAVLGPVLARAAGSGPGGQSVLMSRPRPQEK